MKHFVFENSNGDYELVYSVSMKQAEKDMGSECVAAFRHYEDAKNFVEERNNMWR